MSFLESCEAFKANEGVYDINHVNKIIANRPDEPWHDITQKLAHFVALGGQTVPMSYAATYNITKTGNCFSYATGKEFVLDDFWGGCLQQPGIYTQEFSTLGIKEINVSDLMQKHIELNSKEDIIAQITESNLEKNIPLESIKSYLPILYMIGSGEKDTDYHFLIPHFFNHNKIGLSFRDGKDGAVFALRSLNHFDDYMGSQWDIFGNNYIIQPEVLFMPTASFGQKITLKSQNTETATISLSHNNLSLATTGKEIIERLNKLRFNFACHTLQNNQPHFEIF